MKDHRDIKTLNQAYKEFPVPWRVEGEEGEIVAANGRQVIVTDSGFYPPGRVVAELIVAAMNSYFTP